MQQVSYKTDFAAWAIQQADFMRQGRFSELDFYNLVEEIEDMGKNMHRSIASHMKNLIAHLLKWHIQPSHRGESWGLTIARCRSDIPDLIEDSPSLENDLHDKEWFAKVWKKAVELAVLEMDMHRFNFPAEPIWTVEQILDVEFFPE